MKKIIISGLIIPLALLSGCQLISGLMGGEAVQQDSDLQDDNSEITESDSENGSEQQAEALENQDPNPVEKPEANANPGSGQAVGLPEMDNPSQPADNPAQPADNPALQPGEQSGTLAFKDLDELKKYIAEHPEESQKNNDTAQVDSGLPVKSIKCHVHANGVNTKFFEETNQYDELYSEEGLMKSYCDEKTIKYYGSRDFDFECYEVQKNNQDAKVKGGFDVKRHISCPVKENEADRLDKGLTLLDTSGVPAPSDTIPAPANNPSNNNAASTQNVINPNVIRNDPHDLVNLRCDVKAGDHQMTYETTTNVPEKSLSVESLKKSYCTDYHIKSTGLIYDFDCYQLDADRINRLSGGYSSRVHIECPEEPKNLADAIAVADCYVDPDNTNRVFKKMPNFTKNVTVRGKSDLENARSELTKEFCDISGRNMDRFFISCCFRKKLNEPAGKPPCGQVYYSQIICE